MTHSILGKGNGMENKNEIGAEDTMEIDIGSVFREILNNLLIIILVAVIFALASYDITKLFVRPEYVSTTSIYVKSSNETQNSVNTGELQAGTLLTKDYEEIIQSREVLEKVISEVDLSSDEETAGLTYAKLLSDVSVSTPDDTRVIYIRVTYEDPYAAADLANAIRDASITRIQEVIDIEAMRTVSEANIPTAPASPRPRRNAAVGGLIGAVIAIIVVVVYFLSDSTISTSEDVEKYLHISVLGSIPLADGEIKSKKKHRRNGGTAK